MDALRDCLPVRIKLNMPVEPKDRLKPDAHYDWMPRAGMSFQAVMGQKLTWKVLFTSPIFIAVS